MSVPESRTAVQGHLQMLASLLREGSPLNPEAQRILANLVDELGKDLASPTVPSAEVAHLTESVSRLVEAVHRRRDTGLLHGARDQLDKAVVAAEGQAPVVTGLVRQFVNALSSLGI